MNNSRDIVLGRIRHAIAGRDTDRAAARSAVAAHLADHCRSLQPARIDIDRHARVDLFVEKARKVDATVCFVDSRSEVPSAVADYLRGRNLPAEFVMAPHPDLDAMDWQVGTMTTSRRAPGDKDCIGINRAFGAVAETGTLVMVSGEDSPATINFLPETHIAVVWESEIHRTCEDIWDCLREDGRISGKALPRTINMITGTSRTGDIEQTLQTGVHGPKYLHIVVVKDR